MQEERSKGKRELEDLSRSLGLPYEPQDWGIINADGKRLLEFISYYGSNPLSSAEKFEMGGLILESANEYLLCHEFLPEMFSVFLNQKMSEMEVHLDYWRSLEDDLEFPIANWIRTNIRQQE